MDLKYYLIETFEPTILFGMFCGLLGVIAAWHYGSINLAFGILAIVGVVLSQIAVNLIDDYVDYTSGLDKETVKTKFSGGSEIVVKKLVKLNHVLAIGLVAFVLAALIGIYLIYHNILLLPLAIVGGITVLLYARYLSKVPFLSEPLTTLNFILIPLGCFIAASGSLSNINMFAFAALAVGLQVGVTVIVNYLPDRIPDRKFGRRNAVAMIKGNKGANMLYLAFEALSFLVVILGIALGAIPPASIIVVVTVPLVAGISKDISNYKDPKSFEKTMAHAALAELAFIILLCIAFI